MFAEYYRRYRELVTVKRQLDALNASESDKQRRIEALTAEIDTIDAAALQPGEEKEVEIRIKDEFIKLGQALKLAGVVEDGVEAKYAINDGLVLVNGEVENRRGRKIHPGDTISYDGKDIYVIG